jgi:hypothetical protein
MSSERIFWTWVDELDTATRVSLSSEIDHSLRRSTFSSPYNERIDFINGIDVLHRVVTTIWCHFYLNK